MKNKDDFQYTYEDVNGDQKTIGYSKKAVAKMSKDEFLNHEIHQLASDKNPTGLKAEDLETIYVTITGGSAKPEDVAKVDAVQKVVSEEPSESEVVSKKKK